jgi:hypothetical protein
MKAITPMFKQLEKKSEDWTSCAIFFLQLSDLPIDFKQSVSNMNIYSMQASLSWKIFSVNKEWNLQQSNCTTKKFNMLFNEIIIWKNLKKKVPIDRIYLWMARFHYLLASTVIFRSKHKTSVIDIIKWINTLTNYISLAFDIFLWLTYL